MNGNVGACWQCGAPARDECAYRFKLFAYPGSGADSLGYPVTPGRGMDSVVVRVPRCDACRGRGDDGIVLLFVGMIAGAIAAPMMRALWFANIASGGTASVIGLVVGALLAICGVAWRRRSLGLRALNAYPPVLALRQAGWSPPYS